MALLATACVSYERVYAPPAQMRIRHDTAHPWQLGGWQHQGPGSQYGAMAAYHHRSGLTVGLAAIGAYKRTPALYAQHCYGAGQLADTNPDVRLRLVQVGASAFAGYTWASRVWQVAVLGGGGATQATTKSQIAQGQLDGPILGTRQTRWRYLSAWQQIDLHYSPWPYQQGAEGLSTQYGLVASYTCTQLYRHSLRRRESGPLPRPHLAEPPPHLAILQQGSLGIEMRTTNGLQGGGYAGYQWIQPAGRTFYFYGLYYGLYGSLAFGRRGR